MPEVDLSLSERYIALLMIITPVMFVLMIGAAVADWMDRN